MRSKVTTVHEDARVKDTDADRLNFALLGQKIGLIIHKRLGDNGSPATQIRRLRSRHSPKIEAYEFF
jgi:hypothetical protein